MLSSLDSIAWGPALVGLGLLYGAARAAGAIRRLERRVEALAGVCEAHQSCLETLARARAEGDDPAPSDQYPRVLFDGPGRREA